MGQCYSMYFINKMDDELKEELLDQSITKEKLKSENKRLEEENRMLMASLTFAKNPTLRDHSIDAKRESYVHPVYSPINEGPINEGPINEDVGPMQLFERSSL